MSSAAMFNHRDTEWNNANFQSQTKDNTEVKYLLLVLWFMKSNYCPTLFCGKCDQFAEFNIKW